MKRMIRLAAIAFVHSAFPAMAGPAEALAIQKSWDVAMEKWTQLANAAATPEAKVRVLDQRPDIAKSVRAMWETISPNLREEWTLEPAAWFLRAAPSIVEPDPTGRAVAVFANEIRTIQKAIEDWHVKSPKLVPVCMALVVGKDPHAVNVLEKVISGNPDPKVQGAAALAAAMLLRTLGDDPAVMRRRLTLLRKAIIQSSEVDLGGTPVAKLAEDELYIINNLTKGRVAPDLVGTDSAGRPLTLSSYKDKIILLLFWRGDGTEADRLIEITTETMRKFTGRPFVVIGVNHDSLKKLRELEAGPVTWRNFSDPEGSLAEIYRVGSLPLVYVLDGERKIHYSGTPGSFAELTAEALLAGPAQPADKNVPAPGQRAQDP